MRCRLTPPISVFLSCGGNDRVTAPLGFLTALARWTGAAAGFGSNPTQLILDISGYFAP